MEKEFDSLGHEFDLYIEEIKLSEEYLNYQKSKLLLDESVRAKELLKEVKQLQKIRVNTINRNLDIKELDEEINSLNDEYLALFEVAQFNQCYEVFYNKVETIKIQIENILK